MNRLFFFTLLFLFSVPLLSQNYELVWHDEFDYTGLPASDKWSYDVGGHGWGNNELQYYTEARQQNARVENGTLIIEAHLENYGGSNYTSARLISKDQGDWLYGRIEVKAKLPSGTGTWPAIWMLPTDWEYGGWPASGEIDIMEHVGYEPTTIYGTVHTEAYNHMLGTQVGDEIEVADCEDDFHVYAIEWHQDKIDFFVDNTKYFTFYNEGTWQKWPFDKRFHLLLNIAVGGSWGGAQGVDNSIFPQAMYIDYVRVYQDAASGTAENQPNEELTLYPVPVDSTIHIKLPADFQAVSPYNVTITSASGATIHTASFSNKDDMQINVSGWAQGLYFVSVTNDKETTTSKFIINK